MTLRLTGQLQNDNFNNKYKKWQVSRKEPKIGTGRMTP